AAAILAGVLFHFALGLVSNAASIPALGLPLVALFFAIRLYSPSWAVLVVLAAGFALTYLLDLAAPIATTEGARLALVMPTISLPALIGVGLPLYLVTMASQNLPGFAVLTASGYTPPSRSIVGATGLASVLTAPFGAIPTSLAAITASICTGPDTHPDPAKRWLAGPFYAAGYGVLALAGAFVVALLAAMPAELIGLIAGAALLGPFVGSARLAFSGDGDDVAAAMAFVVTASGLTFFGIGAAFWGLSIGVALTLAARRRQTPG
ncbi:MAG: benzoate/H(+) symporter BenE family transporter, partial [Ruegeria sp.]